MSAVTKVTVHKGAMEWGDGQKMPCWQVDITRAERSGHMTTQQTLVARTFAVNDPEKIEDRRVRANQYAEQLGAIIGANAVSLA